MTNFEKITATPGALGAFLASLSIADGPWDEAFHRMFCGGCQSENCDAENCPHQNERNNPLWWLVQTAEGEQDTRRAALAWRNGRLELEPGMIVTLQDEDRHADGTCNEFNVYLNGKGPDGKALRNIKRVIMPTVSTYENGQPEPMDMKLVFGGCEDAAEIIKLLGKKCKLEIRAAVESRNKTGQAEYHGHRYILEAVPLELKPEPLKRLGGTGVTIGFLVHRYTATAGGTELWSFEWGAQGEEAAPSRATKRQTGINPGRLRRSEILSLARLFHVSIGTATEYHDILAAQAPEEFRLRKIRTVLLVWSFAASAISIVLSLIRLVR